MMNWRTAAPSRRASAVGRHCRSRKGCLRTRLGENCRRKGSHCRGKLTWGCSVACKPLPALGSDQCSVQARSSESNRTHGARAAPNLALRARKPHLDGLLRCRRCGLGQARCAGPGCTRTGGIRGSETRPTSKAQNSGAGARGALRERNQPRNQNAVAENAKQEPIVSICIDPPARGSL